MEFLPRRISALKHPFVLLAVGVACLVGGIRVLLVAAWAGDAPYADDFNSTGLLHVYAAQSPGGMPWSWLVQVHVEHRIVTQKLFSLGVAALNGQQWDVRAEMVISALLWGLLAGGLAALGWQQLRGWALAGWIALVTAAEGIPHAWENLLWSFQVQFLFVAAFGLLALWWLVRSRPLSVAWWGGLVCAVAACGSQASGLVVFPTAMFATGIAMIRQPESCGWRNWAGLAIFALLLALAAAAVGHFPAHDQLRAHSVAHWLRAVVILLSWPWCDYGWTAMALWLPGIIFGVRFVFRRAADAPPAPVDWFWLSVLGWSLAMVFASAWARGEIQILGLPPSRYADVLVIGVLANGFLLLRASGRSQGRSRLLGGMTVLWLAGAIGGMAFYTVQLTKNATPASTSTRLSLRGVIASRPMQADRIRDYVRTHDVGLLETNPPFYPVKEHVAEVIRLLRAAKRWPATLDPGNPPLPRLSRVARGAGTWGWGVLLAGLVCTTMAAAQMSGWSNRT